MVIISNLVLFAQRTFLTKTEFLVHANRTPTKRQDLIFYFMQRQIVKGEVKRRTPLLDNHQATRRIFTAMLKQLHMFIE